METKLQNEPIYTMTKKGLTQIGEITGDFYVIKDFRKQSWDLTLVADNENIYLIIM